MCCLHRPDSCRKFWKELRIKILTQLSTALAGTTLAVSVSSMEEVFSNLPVCQAVAILVQYFFLAFFCWLMIEGLFLYNLFVVVFKIGVKRYFQKALIFAWGECRP